jgi:hypothetical protein
MASAAQTAANQRNAQHSTGPRSAQGKARTAQNAFRHGLTAATLTVRDDERAAFELLRDALLEELDPQGAVETLAFQSLLHAAWSLHRYRSLEALLDIADPNDAATLDRLGRHHSRHQRDYYRALHELRTLQTNRTLRAFKLDENDEPEVPAIVAINDLTKQTHSEVQAEAIQRAMDMLNYESRVFEAGVTGRLPGQSLPPGPPAARARA